MKTSTFIRRLAAVATVALAVALETVAAAGTAAAATAPPTISSFTPTSGPVGTLVTIKGTHFGSPAPGLQVLFNGTLAAPETVIANQITVRVPPLATTGPITVKTRYGTAQTRSSFRVTRGIASFPRGAWPGQSITIAGSGFPRFHDMTFKLDGASFGGVATDANGQFSLLRTLPPTITIGPSHILAAIDTITHTQQKIHIWIFGSWLQPRDDAAQSGNGTAESLITPANVAKVHQHYAVGSFDSQVVEDGGRVFAGTLGNSIGAYNPWLLNNSYFDWTAPTDGTVSQAPAVSNSVVYAVTNDRLYALNEYPAGPGGEIRWTAVLGDSANPFPPVVADGRVYVADRGLGELQVFDANGVTNCSGSPVVCTPLWFASYATVFGPPAIDAKSLGGSGDVYLSVTAGGINKIVVRTGAGAVVGSSSALASTLISGPSLGGSRVFVSGWSSGSAVATLYALDASALTVAWNSTDLGGTAAPTAVAVGGGHAFVQNSDGFLRAFKSAGCGTAICAPLWSSGNYGTGGTTPPTLANGVVYIAAGTQGYPAGLATIDAFDASGTPCSGTPVICSAIAVGSYWSGINSQIVVVAGTVFGQGNTSLSVAEVY